MTHLHTILAYPSKPRLKGALNRIYGYLSRYRANKDKPAKDRSPRAARSPERLLSVPETSKGRLFPGGHRIGDRHSAAIGAGKLMRQQSFSVRPWDPVMLASATLALGLAALLASALPAWRAAGMEPMVALRNE